MISFVIAVLSFVWTTGEKTDEQLLPTVGVAIVLRTVVTVLFGLGLAYFVLAIMTFIACSGSRRSQDTEVEMKEVEVEVLSMYNQC